MGQVVLTGKRVRIGVMPAPVRRWCLALLLGLLAAAAGWVAAVFLPDAEAKVATLPARVQAQLRAEGSPYVPLTEISPVLVQATVAVEDDTFWTNPGVSLEGILRAALVDVADRAWVEGGSTITQQLIRDQLLGYRKSLRRKAVEIAYALVATRRWPKARILEMYLNEVNYGHGAFGVAAASAVYFHRAPSDLDLAQAALLAGLPQDPAGLDPFAHPDAALARRTVVLQAMVRAGDITPAQAEEAQREPLPSWVPAPR
jgi:membrane peptidoglycan carboxypeptidase